MEMKRHVLPQVIAETRSLYLMENYFLRCNQSEGNLCLIHNEVLLVRQKLTKKKELTKRQPMEKSAGSGVRRLGFHILVSSCIDCGGQTVVVVVNMAPEIHVVKPLGC